MKAPTEAWVRLAKRGAATAASLAGAIITLMLFIVIVSVCMAPPARAHTPDEWKVWHNEWSQRAAHGVSPALVDEFVTMYAAHGVPVPQNESSSEQRRVHSGMGNGTSDVAYWEGMIVAYFDTEADRAWARRIMACESGGNQWAQNAHSSASGLFQFLDSTWEWVSAETGVGPDKFDAQSQFINARWLFYNVGPNQWECR